MDKGVKKLIAENVVMKSALSAFLDYAEDDSMLSEEYSTPTVSFPNVVYSMSVVDLEILKKIVN